jgi:hypothetical protein
MFLLYTNRKAIFCLLILICFNTYSQSIDESDFFIYNDGITVPKEDDTHSEQIILSPEIPFITTKYDSIYVRNFFFFCFKKKINIFFRLIQMVFYHFYYQLPIFFLK